MFVLRTVLKAYGLWSQQTRMIMMYCGISALRHTPHSKVPRGLRHVTKPVFGVRIYGVKSLHASLSGLGTIRRRIIGDSKGATIRLLA